MNDDSNPCGDLLQRYITEPLRNFLWKLLSYAISFFFHGSNTNNEDTQSWILKVITYAIGTVAFAMVCFVATQENGAAEIQEYITTSDLWKNADITLWTLGVIVFASVAVYFMFVSDSDTNGGNGNGNGYYYNLWRPSVPKDELGQPEENGAVGLANLGNSCYMSASLQCLNSVYSLRELFLDEDCESNINKENVLGSGGRVVMHFSSLLKRLWSDKITIAAPVKFKQIVGELNSDFGGREQQDASEFMNWLLDQLHEDLNDARRGEAAPMRLRGVSFDALTNTERAQRSDEEYFARNCSPIIDMFFGQQSSTLECLNGCGRQSVAFDPFSLLALEIPPAQVWLEPFVLPVRGMPVQIGLWISQQASLSELIIEICKIVDDLAEGEHGGPLNPESMYLASTDQDGKHIRRRMGTDWCVDDMHLKFPLCALEVPRVGGEQYGVLEKQDDNEDNEDKDNNNDQEHVENVENKNVPYKVVHRVKNESNIGYSLIGTPSLIYIDVDAKMEDVAKVACVLCAKSCIELLLDTVRREEDEYNDELDRDGIDEEYEIIGSEMDEDQQMQTLMQQPWLALLNHGLCELRVVQGSKRTDLKSKQGEDIPVGNEALASDYMQSLHSTICIDWSPNVIESILDLRDPGNCVAHPSFTMERDALSDTSETFDQTSSSTTASSSAQGKETIVSLSQCLDQFTAAEFLSMQCERCGGSEACEHSKQLLFSRLPPVLVISLKRFKNMGLTNSKIETKVSFPIRGLDMNMWLETDNNNNNNNSTNENVYDLVAVVNHSGELGYGHYTAYGLTELGSWVLYDDEDVEVVGKSEKEEDHETAESVKLDDILVTKKAYLLVYVKKVVDGGGGVNV